MLRCLLFEKFKNFNESCSLSKAARMSSVYFNLTLNFEILADQSQIQTKTQAKRTSDPKHIVQTRDNDNICKSIKRKDAKQGKLHKPPISNLPKKKLVTKCPLTKKQQTNSLLTT